MSFRVIAVLDVRAGKVVHARGGFRSLYEPVKSLLGPFSGPVELAANLRDRLGIGELYVADLDSIEGRAGRRDVFATLAEQGVRVWADAGLRGARQANILKSQGVDSLVAATETIQGPSALAEIVSEVGPHSVVFGLDLREGVAITGTGAVWADDRPEGLIEAAIGSGVVRFLLLDLARVGSGRGVGTLGLVGHLRKVLPGAEIVVGGGVADLNELLRLRDAGADGALVASAIHDGRIGLNELEFLKMNA